MNQKTQQKQQWQQQTLNTLDISKVHTNTSTEVLAWTVNVMFSKFLISGM